MALRATGLARPGAVDRKLSSYVTVDARSRAAPRSRVCAGKGDGRAAPKQQQDEPGDAAHRVAALGRVSSLKSFALEGPKGAAPQWDYFAHWWPVAAADSAGWAFAGDGRCVWMPQAEEGRVEVAACRSPGSSARPHAAREAAGLVFVWPVPDDGARAAATPLPLPRALTQHVAGGGRVSWCHRALPFSWDVLLEHLADPSHWRDGALHPAAAGHAAAPRRAAPYAFTPAGAGGQPAAPAAPLPDPSMLAPPGAPPAAAFELRPAEVSGGDGGDGSGGDGGGGASLWVFGGGCSLNLLWQRPVGAAIEAVRNGSEFGAAGAGLPLYATPAGPGSSILLAATIPAPGSPPSAAPPAPAPVLPRGALLPCALVPPAAWRALDGALGLTPRAAAHMAYGRAFDQDTTFLRKQDARLRQAGPRAWRKHYFSPLQSDGLVLAIRSWIDAACGGPPPRDGAAS
ncbi:MAG: hypothetical protein J3K34DRAFT_459376 [Monoraphidium minutum]|nr:MAG: hypothetical protein J3K34DRAFT_459376 [Monoraphidium minutum]